MFIAPGVPQPSSSSLGAAWNGFFLDVLLARHAAATALVNLPFVFVTAVTGFVTPYIVEGRVAPTI